MADREPEKWITVNGVHVPVYPGQSSSDAIKSRMNQNHDDKEKQLTKSKEQSDKLNREEKIKELTKELENTKGLLAKSKIRRKIEMLEENWKGTEEEYIEYRNKKWEEEKAQKEKEYAERKKAEEDSRKAKEEKKKKDLEEELKTQPKHKVEQYKIIQETNPMNDDYHTGIRKPSDIKTWKEAMADNESFSWGDFSRRDAEKALQSGKITIYSSYPIRQGVFVSTSRVQSEQYAGGAGRKVYSKIVPLEHVAWISGDEGQFAEIKEKK